MSMVACLEKEGRVAPRGAADYIAGNCLISDYLPGGLRSTKIFKDADDENDVKPSGFYDEDELENFPTARYRYDGQMTLEEDTTDDLQDGTFIDETRYTLGARGIEAIEAERLEGQDSEGVVVGTKYRSFPVYDGHGNMIATLHREASDTYSIKNEKRYNAWGAVRTYTNGGANLNPNKAYVANLGHTLDWETGLIYMRARYYEPSTGRFISEDPARDGANWFIYCMNNPIDLVDLDGESAEMEIQILLSRIFQDLSKARTRSQVTRLGNAAIRVLQSIRDNQLVMAEDSFAAARIAGAAGNVEGSRFLQAKGAKHQAISVAATLGILQVRAMMYIAECIFDIGT